MSRPRGDEAEMRVDGPVVTRSRKAPEVSYRAFLTNSDGPRVHWASPDGLELSGVGAAARLTADGGHRISSVREDGARVFETVDHDGPPPTRPRFIGGFAFTSGHRAAPPWTGFRGASFVLPRVQLTSYGNETWVSVTNTGPDADPSQVETTLSDVIDQLEELPAMRSSGEPPGVHSLSRTPDKDGWIQQVEDALEKIESDILQKVVLAQRLDATLAGPYSAPDILERVRRSYEDCFRFLIAPTDAATFLGAPPERLLRLTGRTVETEALAGSVPRGETPEADAELADRLRDDEKLRIEQGLVAETIESALAPLGDVSVGERTVRRLSNIQHLQTPIEATLDADTHVLDIVDALHPTPAVGGVPPQTAMQTILETEPFDRGWYAAPVGWMDAAGDGEFAVGIRSAVTSEEQISLFAGNGIVAEADAEEEWTELQQKYEPILAELR